MNWPNTYTSCRVERRVASLKQSRTRRTMALSGRFRQGTFQPLTWLLTNPCREAAR